MKTKGKNLMKNNGTPHNPLHNPARMAQCLDCPGFMDWCKQSNSPYAIHCTAGSPGRAPLRFRASRLRTWKRRNALSKIMSIIK